jgi:pimeloyl-ACP methyl ester carboxylesterase
VRDELAGLDVPSLFLWGESDAFAPPESGEEIAARMPNARFERLPDTGHLPHVEQPETVAAAIAGFLFAHGPHQPHPALR